MCNGKAVNLQHMWNLKWSNVQLMWKKQPSKHNLVSDLYLSLKRNIPKFDTVLLHSNWSSLRRKYLSKIPTDVNALSCGQKTRKISGISDAISPARHPQKSSQPVRVCAAGDGAICSKNRIVVPYHGDNPNTRNGARLRSPSPIMASNDSYSFIREANFRFFTHWGIFNRSSLFLLFRTGPCF